MNLESEYEVQNMVESLCPRPDLRAIYLSIISDGILEANRYDRSGWAINVSKNGVRLTVAHYYVCTIEEPGVWLALDNAVERNPNDIQRYYPSIRQLNRWGWRMDDPHTPGTYPTYKDRGMRLDFSMNGFYTPGKDHPEAWKHIRKLFLTLIYNAIYHGQKMDPDSPATHSSGFLKYVRNQYGIPLLDPLYGPQ